MRWKKSKQIALGCLMGLGMVFAFAGLTACRSNQNIVQEYAIVDAFDSISIDTDTADITIHKSADDTCKVVTSDQEYLRHTVGVQDGILTVKLEDTRKWYQFIQFHVEETSIAVYLPETEYKTLVIDESTGNIGVVGFQFENVDISLSTGDVELYDSTAENLKIKTSTGNIKAENASAKSMDLSASTGDIHLLSATAEDIKLSVTTGKMDLQNVTCTNLTTSGDTGKLNAGTVNAVGTVTVERTTGDVALNDVTAGGLNITTSTGNINLTKAICGDVQLTVSTGKTTLTDMTCINLTSTGDTGKLTMNNVVASGKFILERTTGDITLNGCDAAELEVKATTGDVEGTLLSDKVFITKASTGKIRVPETVVGGTCKITTTTGDITIEIKSN